METKTQLQTQIPENELLFSQTEGGAATTPPVKVGRKFGVFTWGSCKRGRLRVWVYVEKKWKEIELPNRGEGEKEVEGVLIRYEIHDSRKNLNREYEVVESKSPVAIWHYVRGSCNPRSVRETAILCTYECKEVEIKEKEIQEEDERAIVTYKARVIETPWGDVVIDKEFKAKELKAVQKPRVKAKLFKAFRDSNALVVELSGETYQIKEALKQMGYRWDAYNKVWAKACVNVVDVVNSLKNIADVSLYVDYSVPQDVIEALRQAKLY